MVSQSPSAVASFSSLPMLLYSLWLASPRVFQEDKPQEEKQALVRSMLASRFWWHIGQSQSHVRAHLWERTIQGHEDQNVCGSSGVPNVTVHQHMRGHPSWLLPSSISQSSIAFPNVLGHSISTLFLQCTSPSMKSCHLQIEHLIL